MLSRRVFNQQWVAMRGDKHYEVVQPIQSCWTLATPRHPIACILLLSQNDNRASQRDCGITNRVDLIVERDKDVDVQIVLVNLLFDRLISFSAHIPNSNHSMEGDVKPGGALAIPINFQLVRAFVLQCSSYNQNDVADAEWKFTPHVLCRPRHVERMMPLANLPTPMRDMTFGTGRTNIGDAGPIPFDDVIAQQEEEPPLLFTTPPVQVFISVDAHFDFDGERLGSSGIVQEGARVMAECILANEGF